MVLRSSGCGISFKFYNNSHHYQILTDHRVLCKVIRQLTRCNPQVLGQEDKFLIKSVSDIFSGVFG